MAYRFSQYCPMLGGQCKFHIIHDDVSGLFWTCVNPISDTLSPVNEELKEIGFKKSKTYDAKGLIGVESVYYGFWGLDPYDRKDYEVRFFSSHSDAVELGTAQADERSGADAILDEEESTWPVGMKDARQCGGDKGAGPVSHGIQNYKSPKYWDYSIYGNMILLCSGGNLGAAQNLCNDLLVVLDPPPDVN